jgi:hypothetical protein
MKKFLKVCFWCVYTTLLELILAKTFDKHQWHAPAGGGGYASLSAIALATAEAARRAALF